MEPLNCTAHVRPDGCDVWVPTQAQTLAQQVAADLTGLPKESVRIHTTFLGGGFGRRFEPDVVSEAVRVSKAAGAPVKVIWSREDDVRHGFYRPASHHRLAAGIDSAGRPVAWTHRVVGPAIGHKFGVLPNGVDNSLIDGAKNLFYAIPNVAVFQVVAELPVPIGFWRSVGASVTGFVVEGFIDELAAAAGEDPFEFRRKRLSKHPRHKAVLELVAEKSGWGKPLPQGRARGIALMECFGSIVGQVAEVSVANGNVKIHKIWCAVDAGWIINPDTIKAQMEGGTLYGLSAALNGEITIQNGRVVQRHFNDYKVVRHNDAPVVETHIVPSAEAPGGIGEPSTALAAGALVNAIAAATGKRIYKLPIRPEQLRTNATARA